MQKQGYSAEIKLW